MRNIVFAALVGAVVTGAGSYMLLVGNTVSRTEAREIARQEIASDPSVARMAGVEAQLKALAESVQVLRGDVKDVADKIDRQSMALYEMRGRMLRLEESVRSEPSARASPPKN